jgi:hypothetical protein
MARSYSARLVALTLDCPIKWVDNLLSHHVIPGVSRSRQGVQRRVTDEGLLAIELTRMLTSELGVPISKATAIARATLQNRSASRLRFVTESGIDIVFPIEAIEVRLRQRIVQAIESVASIPRGRPPRVNVRGA